jgi:hypothetical protein
MMGYMTFKDRKDYCRLIWRDRPNAISALLYCLYVLINGRLL